MSMSGVTKNSVFDLNRYKWPPVGHLEKNRFVTKYDYVSSGAFRDVYLAKDTVTGQALVAKRFKQPGLSWGDDVLLARVTQKCAAKFNKHLGYECISCITPFVDGCTREIGGPFQAGEKIIIEPCIGISNYTKFNSNSGWHDEKTKEMAAFTHYTYALSDGQLIVCDLQGVKREGGKFILTDPAVCSVSRGYGSTDIGEQGICSFFANHVCNDICAGWKRHPRPGRMLNQQRNTTFQQQVKYH